MFLRCGAQGVSRTRRCGVLHRRMRGFLACFPQTLNQTRRMHLLPNWSCSSWLPRLGSKVRSVVATCSRFRATPAACVQAHQTRATELKISLMRMLQQKVWELKLRQAALELHLSRRLHIHRRRSSHHPRRWFMAIGAHPSCSSRHPSCSCRFAASRSWMPRHPSCSCRAAAGRSWIPHHPGSLAEAG